MTSPESTHSLTVERVYSASPERVFAAWIDPEILRRWYAPVDGWVVSHAESDPRPGGEYRISFGPAPDGNTYTEHGTYEVVEPGQLLRWRLELSGTSIECTVVEVSFEAVADGRPGRGN
ncbi:MAG: SRPBCC domain-containing protein, partial [Actinobacteria bacterium]|nr:SRPBCC domain-containing protein [Actinomycetota bacterium]